MKQDGKWLLTDEEGEKAVGKWIAQDFSVRCISLGRGNWEQLVPVIARAQLLKVAEKIAGLQSLKSWEWAELRHAAGL
mgnify:CR=1 FL=1